MFSPAISCLLHYRCAGTEVGHSGEWLQYLKAGHSFLMRMVHFSQNLKENEVK